MQSIIRIGNCGELGERISSLRAAQGIFVQVDHGMGILEPVDASTTTRTFGNLRLQRVSDFLKN
jgi:hypothetical protein